MLTFLSQMIIGPALPAFLLFAGAFMNIRLKCFPITKAKYIAKSIFHNNHSSGITPFKALCVALAGTLGVGNIVGVAVAIRTGGPGALFWMWVSALFSMILKYGETVLSLRHRKEIDSNGKVVPINSDKISCNQKLVGGAMYYISSKPIAALFALLCLASSFTVGNLLQSNAVGEAFKTVFGIPELLTGILLAIITFVVIFRGIERISAFCAIVIPILSLGYILMSLIVIAQNLSLLPSVFRSILESAFSLRSVSGGILGSALCVSMRVGFARGLITNEAGCGTAPIAHASAVTDQPAKQGFLGIVEVFFDTIILCTMTGLVILFSIDKFPTLDGIALVNAAFGETFGDAAGILIALAVSLFVIATLVGWSFYGRSALEYFTRNRVIGTLYCLVFALTAIVGTTGAADTMWALSDITCGLMTFISTGSILWYAKEIKEETDGYFKKEKS